MQLREGSVIGHYRLLNQLGEGGMGVVYKALNVKLDRHAALKFLPEQLGHDETARKRLLVEARAAAALDHINICTIFEVGETDEGQVFISMAYYEGQTLRERLQEGSVSLGEAQDLAFQIVCGLAAAHEQRIVHRDIKPSNIMITDAGVVKLLDFGIAKVAGVALTRTGTSVGTLEYMAPEQAQGKADARSDLWALGVLFYEMLAGHRPFKSMYERALAYEVLFEEPDYEVLERRGVAPPLIAVIRRCLSKDPDRRYQTAEALLEDLAKEDDETGEANAVGLPADGPAMKPIGRRLRVPLYVPAAMAALLTIALSWFLIASRASNEDETGRSRLSIATSPPGVAVYLGDSLIGVTPFGDLAVAPGSSTVALRLAGFVPLDTTVLLEPEDRQEWALVLVPDPRTTGAETADDVALQSPPIGFTEPPPARLPSPPQTTPNLVPSTTPPVAQSSGTLVLRAVPSGSISVAGQSGSGTARLTVSAGTHTITFRHPQYGQKQATVQVSPGQTREITCYFEGRIGVAARLDGGGGPAPFAAVWVNGQNTGQFTPTSLTRGPGTYRIRISREGYETLDAEQTVTIAPSLEPISRRVSFRLAPQN